MQYNLPKDKQFVRSMPEFFFTGIDCQKSKERLLKGALVDQQCEKFPPGL